MHPIEVLERYFNHSTFRPNQEAIIDAVLENNDVFALLPTGGGKSICFQIPALIKDGICIVISPLIALMKDQVLNLNSRGIKAIALTSGMSKADVDTQLDNCIFGHYKFLYISPERLLQPLVQERIARMNVNLIAVDEAHCISQWGNDFRPAYKTITKLRSIHPQVNCIALTATAKAKVVKDIITNLELLHPKVIKASFYRPNLSYHIWHTEDKLHKLKYILEYYKGTSIIYVRTRKATKQLYALLEAKGFSCIYYHGGLTNSEKQQRLLKWINGQTRIMIATTAFGMGIDNPHVETVIHFNLPESLESYYQEAGRAGRNGNKAYAFLLKQPVDEEKLQHQFLKVLPSASYIKKIYKHLYNYFQISYGEGQHTTLGLDFRTFCKTYDLKFTLTYNVLKILDQNSVIELSTHFTHQSRIQFLVSNTVLIDFAKTHPTLNPLIMVLLRNYGGISDFETKVNITQLAQKINSTENQIIHHLEALKKHNIISFTFSKTDTEITFLKPREDQITINPILKTVTQQHKLKYKQIKAVLDYVNDKNTCNTKKLLYYFGEIFPNDCGECSVCLQTESSNFSNTKKVSDQILNALATQNLSSRQLLSHLKYPETILLNVISELLELKKIKITAQNTYTLI